MTWSLQWGRAVEGAETLCGRAGKLEERWSFNGAAPLKARKPASQAAEYLAAHLLQWGRAVEGAETRRRDAREYS